ncbi:MAG: sugar ABC transporter permease [Erysipelotrichaceae bacterium]|nr:sugar ABC transporter permease [Erysipelotrichaceae bacterium]
MDKAAKLSKRKSVSYAKWGYLFILPFFLVYFVFTLYPQLLTFYNSLFENYMDGLTHVGPNFVGLGNFVKLFSPDATGSITIIKYFGNTVVLWILGALPQFIFALILALFFTSTRLKIKGQGFFKAVIYMPNLIMAAAFAMLIFGLFGNTGPINKMLVAANMPTFDFLAEKISVRGLIALMNFLMWFGNTTILLMAGIQGIDECLFESARIDGASSTRVFFDVTLPLLKPILVYVAITSMIGGMQMYDVPQVLTNGYGMPDNTSSTMVMLLNKYLNPSRNYGMSGAISVILFAITGILSLIVLKATNKED